MGNKFYILFLLIIQLVSGLAFADSVSGQYQGRGDWGVVINHEGDGRYRLISGDVSQGVKSCDQSGYKICLSFSFVELLVPTSLVVGQSYELNGSVVDVGKMHDELKFGSTTFKNVHKLNVKRSKYIDVDGKPKMRSSKDREFELLYSSDLGLLGFRELPSKREDYFIVDWRSLESRKP